MQLINKTTISYLIVLGAIIVLVAFFAFVQNTDTQTSGVVAVDQPDTARVFEKEGNSPYQDLDGISVDLSEFEDTVLVVNAWASWCPFCVEELPDFAKLKSEFGDEVVVIAINRKESAATQKAFLDSIGNPDNILFLQDKNDFFYRSIGGFSMPETMFYDKDGNISLHKRGFMAVDEMRQHTEAALARTTNE